VLGAVVLEAREAAFARRHGVESGVVAVAATDGHLSLRHDHDLTRLLGLHPVAFEGRAQVRWVLDLVPGVVGAVVRRCAAATSHQEGEERPKRRKQPNFAFHGASSLSKWVV